MYEDEDEWPIRCPHCHEYTHKQIGWLKTNTRLRCVGCDRTLWYHHDVFMHALNML